MNKFESALTAHMTGNPVLKVFERMKLIALLLVANVIWAILVTKFLGFLWPEVFGKESGAMNWVYQFFFTPAPPYRWQFFMSVIAAPLWEELAFRVAPYKIAKNLGAQYFVPVMILSTILFGWGHGAGTISLLFQGFGGLFLTYAYVKTGYSYWSSVTLH